MGRDGRFRGRGGRGRRESEVAGHGRESFTGAVGESVREMLAVKGVIEYIVPSRVLYVDCNL